VTLFLIVSTALADPVKLPRPVHVDLQLKSDPKKKISADAISYDDAGVTVKTKSAGEATYRWIDVVPSNAFIVRRMIAEPRSANDWLQLGKFGWDIGATSQATNALNTAAKMDRSLKPEVDLALRSAPGRLLKPPATQGADEPTTQPSESPAGTERPPVAQPTKRLDSSKVVKYQPATPEESAAAIEDARKLAKKVSDHLGITFVEFQTDHFICFNDWDARETNFLKSNLEGAYATASKQFDIPVKENVFVGKLPIFMFARHADFTKFASDVDHFSVPNTVAGYYATMVNQEGQQSGGHMAMWKPDITGNNVSDAERQWAYTLTHEFTHAFVARYRTNQRIPRWLNEGVAEVIANGKFPRQGVRDYARGVALSGKDVISVFDDNNMPGGEMYPVMMTLVETLIAHDRQAFLKYFNDIKAGVDPEEALKKHFHTDHDGLVKAWKKYLTTMTGTGK
jgi:hypothetical protein